MSTKSLVISGKCTLTFILTRHINSKRTPLNVFLRPFLPRFSFESHFSERHKTVVDTAGRCSAAIQFSRVAVGSFSFLQIVFLRVISLCLSFSKLENLLKLFSHFMRLNFRSLSRRRVSRRDDNPFTETSVQIYKVCHCMNQKILPIFKRHPSDGLRLLTLRKFNFC